MLPQLYIAIISDRPLLGSISKQPGEKITDKSKTKQPTILQITEPIVNSCHPFWQLHKHCRPILMIYASTVLAAICFLLKTVILPLNTYDFSRRDVWKESGKLNPDIFQTSHILEKYRKMSISVHV